MRSRHLSVGGIVVLLLCMEFVLGKCMKGMEFGSHYSGRVRKLSMLQHYFHNKAV